MTIVKVDSVNELQINICRHVMDVGFEVNPRGFKTKEVLGFGFILTNPRARLTTLSARKWSAALAVAELCWNVRGEDEVSALEFYNPRWRDFADSGGLISGSCYGAKIFKATDSGFSQWDNLVRLLKADPSSRRAILNFRSDEDVSRDTGDISCTNTIQFILRGGVLHAFVSMRSNDAIWGVPYDAFLFTCLQELMAVELGVDVGDYHHNSASMHIYERHFELSEFLANSEVGDIGLMPNITSAAAARRLSGLTSNEEILRKSLIRVYSEVDQFEDFCMKLLLRHKKFS